MMMTKLERRKKIKKIIELDMLEAQCISIIGAIAVGLIMCVARVESNTTLIFVSMTYLGTFTISNIKILRSALWRLIINESRKR